MKIESLTSPADMETSRAPSEYITWYDGLLDKIWQIDDDELSEQVLMRTGLAKRFYEELFPLFALLRHKKDDWGTSRISPALGNQKYDVRIDSERSNIPSWLEITYAISGRDNKLRMRHMVDFGFTSMTGPVVEDLVNGRRVTRIIEEAKMADDTVKEVTDLIEKRISDKSSNGYPARTGLIIWVEDYGTFRAPKYFAKLQDLIDRTHSIWSPAFSHIFLLLSSNGSLYEKRG
jgi:hypothetical protein